MSAYVIDASVVVKWFIPESDSDSAARLRKWGLEIHAPEFLLLEVGNVFWKHLRQGKLTTAVADEAIEALEVAPIRWHATGPLFAQAFRIAKETQRTVYDCTYLALALQVQRPLVTADRKFYDAIQTGPFASSVIWIGDIP
ncbi:MAG TPA: type II toxin-antitoxin system VapC family toxin [Thermoanaerobaculia bacterium]|nr:type II toxin-antitoxin system VapC family toxin [Thermoanaerobaculia bacterium]